MWHSVTLYPPSGGCWTCKEGPASLPKLNIFLVNTCCQKETSRKLTLDLTAWCIHGSLPVREESISSVFWVQSRARLSPVLLLLLLLQVYSAACLDTLLHNLRDRQSLVFKTLPLSLYPRENCFNLIKWKRNLKWLNVYLLTGRNVL